MYRHIKKQEFIQVTKKSAVQFAFELIYGQLEEYNAYFTFEEFEKNQYCQLYSGILTKNEYNSIVLTAIKKYKEDVVQKADGFFKNKLKSKINFKGSLSLAK